MINLLTNANKFTEKGTISIKVNFEKKYTEGKKVRFKLEGEQHQSNESLLKIEVIDTGIGINPNEKLSLFQPFERSYSNNLNPNGVGLGLSICKQLV